MRNLFFFGLFVIFFLFEIVAGISVVNGFSFLPSSGKSSAFFLEPLTIHSKNPRYFSDCHGNPVFLTGSHTWNNFQDIVKIGDSQPFEYRAYLEFLEKHGHNFIRLWTWEQAAWISTVEGEIRFHPMAYQRTGPGTAVDGGAKFDLSRFNEEYFGRLRSRVIEAREHGMYVAVMLFQGFGIERKDAAPDNSFSSYLRRFFFKIGLEHLLGADNNPWHGHPFNRRNNINNIDGDPEGKGDGRDVHTLRHPPITYLQEEYVKKVIDTLFDQGNVLWEIANESHVDSTAWQYRMIDFIRKYEKYRGNKHPILMTVQWPSGSNNVLFESMAEAISPNSEGGFKDGSAIADGRKVILVDTDHLWGIGGNWQWVWKSFLMGMNPIFMDPYNLADPRISISKKELELIRKNMGYARKYAEKVDLGEMLPRPDLVSSGYCLGRPGREYLVYVPQGTDVTIDLSGADGSLFVEWLDPVTGTKIVEDFGRQGKGCSVRSPFAGDAILYLSERSLP